MPPGMPAQIAADKNRQAYTVGTGKIRETCS